MSINVHNKENFKKSSLEIIEERSINGAFSTKIFQDQGGVLEVNLEKSRCGMKNLVCRL